MTATFRPVSAADDPATRAAGSGPGVTVRMIVHFDDLDAIGIVHNARYAVLLERAMSQYWASHGVHFHDGRPSHPDGVIAVRELRLSYLAPMRGTGEVDVRFWAERVGTTSATYGFAFVSTDGSVTHADGHRVVVKIDPRTGRPQPWSNDFAHVLEELRA